MGANATAKSEKTSTPRHAAVTVTRIIDSAGITNSIRRQAGAYRAAEALPHRGAITLLRVSRPFCCGANPTAVPFLGALTPRRVVTSRWKHLTVRTIDVPDGVPRMWRVVCCLLQSGFSGLPSAGECGAILCRQKGPFRSAAVVGQAQPGCCVRASTPFHALNDTPARALACTLLPGPSCRARAFVCAVHGPSLPRRRRRRRSAVTHLMPRGHHAAATRPR